MVASINSNFSIENFSALEITAKRVVYQEANESHDVSLVRELNSLGMKPEVPSFSGPTIISNFMDIATKHDTILGFLKKLRQSNRLLTEKEFQSSLSEKKWFQKSNLSRILGCNHLMIVIMENKLKHIKVPIKIAVVEDVELLKISGWEAYSGYYEIHSDQIKIYAEAIKPIERKLSRDEINELIQAIVKAKFIDLWPENIVVAEDGVYFIDTEFKSFNGSICWEKMGRFESVISEEDKTYFQKKVREKMEEPKSKEKNCGYNFFESVLDMIKEFPQSLIEKSKDKIEKIKAIVLNLEYVGAKKVGVTYNSPNKFVFNLKNIII